MFAESCVFHGFVPYVRDWDPLTEYGRQSECLKEYIAWVHNMQEATQKGKMAFPTHIKTSNLFRKCFWLAHTSRRVSCSTRTFAVICIYIYIFQIHFFFVCWLFWALLNLSICVHISIGSAHVLYVACHVPLEHPQWFTRLHQELSSRCTPNGAYTAAWSAMFCIFHSLVWTILSCNETEGWKFLTPVIKTKKAYVTLFKARS